MGRKNYISGRKKEQGIIITLVAVFMLAVIGAMAALSIDAVTLYTARSEAQLAADAGALAGARALANSGTTSDFTGASISSAETVARAIATEVAATNQVGGSYLNGSTAAACAAGNPTGQQICVSFNENTPGDPRVTVTVQRADLPTFFARLLGSTQLKVTAVAKAEAYNPSGVVTSPKYPVAPTCVKPWLLPNISADPGAVNPRIFDPTTGAILDTTLLGWATNPGVGSPGKKLRTACTTDCAAPVSGPSAWRYYPGTTDPAGSPAPNFPPPPASSVTCSGCSTFTPYQLSIAGCVQTPIACNSTVTVDTSSDATRDTDTLVPVNDMTHATPGADKVQNSSQPPFQFEAGADDPLVLSGALTDGALTTVSDSLVTVPVINADAAAGLPPTYPTVQIIGFVQLFLNPYGAASPLTGRIRTQVINLVGCGSNATGQPILGNGLSPVAVRLISQQ